MGEGLIGKQVGAWQARSEEHLKHPDRWPLFEQLLNFTCCKACDVVGEDAFGVASLHSSILFHRAAGTAWQELEGQYLWISELRFEDLKTVTFYVWTLQEDTQHKVTFTYLLEPFSSFLHVWPCRRQLSHASKKRRALMKLWGRWLLFEQLLFFPKHVTLSEKMRFTWLVSIPLALLASSEVLSCTHQAGVSLDMLEKCQLLAVRIPSLFEHNVLKAVGRTQIEGSCKVYAGRTSWKTNWKLYPWSLASKKWGALEAPWQMTPIRASFVFTKACDIVGEDAFSVASVHSIGLTDIKWGTVIRRGAYISLDMLKKCQLLPVRIPSLFQQNVLKAVGRKHIEGSCKVYARKNNWKTSWKLYPWSQWGALEAPWQMTPIRATFKSYLLQSMWRSRRRCVWRC